MEIEFVDPLKDEKDKREVVWHDPVPIVATGDTYHCYLHDEITEPFDYTKFCLLLRTVSKDKQIRIYLNTPGGDLASALAIIDAMTECKAPITVVLSGTVASAGTMVTMAADNIEVSPFISFMIHYYSSSSFGKGNEIQEEVKFNMNHKPFIFNAIYNDFLTKKEIKDVVNGKDMWMDRAEILDRWGRKTNVIQGN